MQFDTIILLFFQKKKGFPFYNFRHIKLVLGMEIETSPNNYHPYYPSQRKG